MRVSAAMLTVVLAFLGGGVGGCRVSGPTSAEVPAGRYGEAFEVVKDELRAQGYELERVDARAGVITTRPRASSGFWTPWVTDERRLRDELESSVHRQRRVVEVRFLAEGEGDVREAGGALTLDVRVRVERVYQPGVRTPVASVRLRHVSEDPGVGSGDTPLETGEGRGAIFAVEQGADRALAADLAARLRRALGLGVDRRG